MFRVPYVNLNPLKDLDKLANDEIEKYLEKLDGLEFGHASQIVAEALRRLWKDKK